ncbi:MAG: hypothetical protein ACT4OM_03345 [Actinomycetota bacterium]
MSNWQVSVSNSKRLVPQQIVASYTAAISLEVERSHFQLNHALSREELFEGIARPPAWPTASPWIAPQDSSDRELTRSAFMKLVAALAFAAELESDSQEGIRHLVDKRFAGVAKERELERRGFSTHRYKIFEVRAQILDDGSPVWGFDVPTAGEMIPGTIAGRDELAIARAVTSDSGRELDLYLQNLARADLMGLLLQIS